MAETQSTHRQEIEKDVIKADIRKTHLGQIFAFIVTSLLIGSGMYLLAFTDKVIVGTSIIIPTIIINGLIFVYGKWVSRKERIRRTENLSDSKENN